jgi:hypothetical protein
MSGRPWPNRQCCRRHHEQDTGKPALRQARRAERPEFREPGRALARFTESHLLPGYGQAHALRCWLFPLAAVYAVDREAADAFADAHDLRGPLAHQHHAEMSS